MFDPDGLFDLDSEGMLLLMAYYYGIDVEELRRRLQERDMNMQIDLTLQEDEEP